MRLLAALLPVVVFLAVPVIAQRGARPKDTLNPRFYDQLSRSPGDVIEDELKTLGAVATASDRKLNEISAQYAFLLKQQDQIVQQLRDHDVRAQVNTDSEHLRNLDNRVSLLESSQRNDPSDIAVLKTQMDGLMRFMVWLLAGVGSLMLGGIAVILRRFLAVMFGENKMVRGGR